MTWLEAHDTFLQFKTRPNLVPRLDMMLAVINQLCQHTDFKNINPQVDMVTLKLQPNGLIGIYSENEGLVVYSYKKDGINLNSETEFKTTDNNLAQARAILEHILTLIKSFEGD